MKKNYEMPALRVIAVKSTHMLCYSQEKVISVSSGDVGIGYNGGSNQAARVKGNSVEWDDWSE